MKKDSILINVSRGAIVDQDALLQALKNNEIGGCGLDVTVPEPLPVDHPSLIQLSQTELLLFLTLLLQHWLHGLQWV